MQVEPSLISENLDGLTDDFQSIYAVNVVGAYQMIKAVVPHMKTRLGCNCKRLFTSRSQCNGFINRLCDIKAALMQ